MSDQPASPLAPTVSPLLEADPSSLNHFIQERVDDIFNQKPTAKDANGNYILTDEKLTVMVEYYKKNRLRFMQESLEKENKPPRAKKAAPTSVSAALKASIALLDDE